MATAQISPEQEVHEVLSTMLRAGDLPPGTKLAEVELAEAFGVSRERVRKVLVRLGSERKLDLIPNRGAFVPTPTMASVREAFDARRVIEAGMALFLSTRLSDNELSSLVDSLASESRPGRGKPKPDLAEDFHLRLAALTGNAHLGHVMQELLASTSMLAPRGTDAAPLCGAREHEQIAAALKQRNGPLAAELVSTHLSLMETRLRPPGDAPVSHPPVKSIIADRLRERRGVTSRSRIRAVAAKRA